jgi:hypothetical protein
MSGLRHGQLVPELWKHGQWLAFGHPCSHRVVGHAGRGCWKRWRQRRAQQAALGKAPSPTRPAHRSWLHTCSSESRTLSRASSCSSG